MFCEGFDMRSRSETHIYKALHGLWTRRNESVERVTAAPPPPLRYSRVNQAATRKPSLYPGVGIERQKCVTKATGEAMFIFAVSWRRAARYSLEQTWNIILWIYLSWRNLFFCNCGRHEWEDYPTDTLASSRSTDERSAYIQQCSAMAQIGECSHSQLCVGALCWNTSTSYPDQSSTESDLTLSSAILDPCLIKCIQSQCTVGSVGSKNSPLSQKATTCYFSKRIIWDIAFFLPLFVVRKIFN